MLGRRSFGDDEGAVLVETALGIVLILLIALPFGSLLAYAAQVSSDVAAVHASARALVHTKTIPASSDLVFTCGSSANEVLQPCALDLPRGSYVAISRDTAVALPFGIMLHTNARAVARVG